MTNPKLVEEKNDLAVCNRFHTLQLPRAGYALSLVTFQIHTPPPLSQMTEQPKRTQGGKKKLIQPFRICILIENTKNLHTKITADKFSV